MKEEFHGAIAMGIHSLTTLPFWLALAGVVVSWYFYLVKPSIPDALDRFFTSIGIKKLLDEKYYMDHLYINGFAAGGRVLGTLFLKVGDTFIIDGLLVNGTAKLVGLFSVAARKLQTGYIYHYAFAMIIGAIGLMTWWIAGLLA
jgi:NADH-quinone oxidoreductase subunit L